MLRLGLARLGGGLLLGLALVCAGCGGAAQKDSGAAQKDSGAAQPPAASGATAGGSATGEQQAEVSKVIATVNGKPLYRAFYEQNLSFMRNRLPAGADAGSMDLYLNARFDALDRLVEDELIYQEAQRRGLMASDADVQADYDRMAEAAGGEAPFLATMYAQHITRDGALEAVRRKLTVDQFIKKMIDPMITVTDSEMAQYYNTHLKRFTPQRWSRVSHVLVICPRTAESDIVTRAAQRASQIAANARAGTSFEQLAKEFSEDAASAARGGSLGWMKAGESVPEFDEVVERLAPGEVSDPVRTDHGFHVIKVVEVKGGAPLPLEEVKDACREAVVTTKKAEYLRSLTSQLRSSAEIVSYLN